ncbi:MAG: glycoside hydrolase family 16 protein [Bacteroidia bacterium]
MRKTVIILSCFLFHFLGFSQTPANDPLHWQMIWKDDFIQKIHYPSGDPLIKYGNSDIRGTSGTVYWTIDGGDHGGEPQAYTPNNVAFVANEGLVLTTKKEEYNCVGCTYAAHHYTSGSLSVNPARKVKYGYIEAKIKLIDTYGLWPAFWTWSQTGNVPSDPNWDYDEIDIFEMNPGTLNTCILKPFHETRQTKSYSTTNIHSSDINSEGKCTGAENERGLMHNLTNINGYADGNAHTYGMEWSPSKLIFYYDGLPIRVSPNPGYPSNINGEISNDAFIILNQAMKKDVAWDYPTKGTNGIYDPTLINYADYFDGKIDAVNYYSGPRDINTNPSKMKIESVSYYTLNDIDCSYPITINSGNINAADNSVKLSITTSGTINLPASKTWRAADNILINGDFYSNGYELYLDANPCY